jgi:Predicted xylanase/chitin deacetylase
LAIISSLSVVSYKSYSEVKEYKSSIELVNKQNSELEAKNKELQQDLNSLKDKNEELSQRISQLDTAQHNTKGTATSPSKNSSEKVAYLTFDDGPSNNTVSILKTLKDNGIHATFFVNGHPEQTSIYKQIISEGNLIENHTYSHEYSTVYSSKVSFNNDVDKLNDFLVGIGIPKPTMIRFPGGSNNTVSYNYGGKGLMNELTKDELQKGYQYVDWNVSSGDAEKVTETKQNIINNVMKEAKGNNSIVILFHDSKPKTTTAEALPEIISKLKSQGYTFKLLSSDSPVVHFK